MEDRAEGGRAAVHREGPDTDTDGVRACRRPDRRSSLRAIPRSNEREGAAPGGRYLDSIARPWRYQLDFKPGLQRTAISASRLSGSAARTSCCRGRANGQERRDPGRHLRLRRCLANSEPLHLRAYQVYGGERPESHRKDYYARYLSRRCRSVRAIAAGRGVARSREKLLSSLERPNGSNRSSVIRPTISGAAGSQSHGWAVSLAIARAPKAGDSSRARTRASGLLFAVVAGGRHAREQAGARSVSLGGRRLDCNRRRPPTPMRRDRARDGISSRHVRRVSNRRDYAHLLCRRTHGIS